MKTTLLCFKMIASLISVTVEFVTKAIIKCSQQNIFKRIVVRRQFPIPSTPNRHTNDKIAKRVGHMLTQ